jgi:hypothetical protein
MQDGIPHEGYALAYQGRPSRRDFQQLMSYRSSTARTVVYRFGTYGLTFNKVLIEESTAVNHESAKVLSSVFVSRAYLMRYSK